MWKAGLVSVSFRKNTPEEILTAMEKARLSTVEWGGDIHIPAGDWNTADKVYKMTHKRGIEVSAYGSYYRLGEEGNREKQKEVLETAGRLHTSRVRIWGGNKNACDLSDGERKRLAEEAGQFGEAAKAYGIRICLECHNQTVTDDYRSALSFFEECASDNVGGFWQPNQFRSEEYNIEAAKAYAPLCDHIHVFHWDSRQRYPLDLGKKIWKQYMNAFAREKKDVDLMLEFMHDDDIRSLEETAKTLHKWISEEEK